MGVKSPLSNPFPEIGIFGGTFNPIHFGHLRLAEETRELFNLKEIIFIPSCRPPLKKQDVIGVEDRFEMVRLAVADNPFFSVSDIECARQGPSYTVDTLKQLKQSLGHDRFGFILGIDAFLELPQWYKPDEIVGLTDLLLVNRPPHRMEELYSSPFVEPHEEQLEGGLRRLRLKGGRFVYLLPIEGLNISASDIRRRLKNHKSIKYLLPESVESYIISKGLYE
ncbi:MAG: nicotinate (nicotinamide) nucleotide adenylyltransferase [Nitrospirae bacterium]|nr:MAG: nicotinate (nicotinamide) nucleotide adenylyltransferase [Nitrospirota bacterium]